jgi:hypothetical protein
MAADNTRTAADVQRELEAEREQLAGAAEALRAQLGEATDITGKLRTNLPAVAIGVFAVGFFLAGGVGATAKLFFRRSREAETVATLGPFRLVERD